LYILAADGFILPELGGNKPLLRLAPKSYDKRMTELLRLLEEMKRSGLISDYAIGGATALIHYFEPFQTADIDVFVVLTDQRGVLINLAPIYSFLASKGVTLRNEYVLVGGIPVQFLVPYNELVEESVRCAKTVPFAGEQCRIPLLEYLMAIMVQTGRAKDKARLEELGKFPELFNRAVFEELIGRFRLEEQWKKIKSEIVFP
jgi:hypothetical protein